ncbi:hypothetical protein J6590_000156 [Homalodisca vitripennis]|nr:hypothetical protein J6590_000156 [Homalodisca vitripennis]
MRLLYGVMKRKKFVNKGQTEDIKDFYQYTTMEPHSNADTLIPEIMWSKRSARSLLATEYTPLQYPALCVYKDVTSGAVLIP